MDGVEARLLSSRSAGCKNANAAASSLAPATTGVAEDGGRSAVAASSVGPAAESVAATPGQEKASSAATTKQGVPDPNGQPPTAEGRCQETDHTNTQTMVTALSTPESSPFHTANPPPENNKQKRLKRSWLWASADEWSAVDHSWMHCAGVYLVIVVMLGSLMVAYMLRQSTIRHDEENSASGDLPTTTFASAHDEDLSTSERAPSTADDGWSTMHAHLQGVESVDVDTTAPFFPSAASIVNSDNDSQVP